MKSHPQERRGQTPERTGRSGEGAALTRQVDAGRDSVGVIFLPTVAALPEPGEAHPVPELPAPLLRPRQVHGVDVRTIRDPVDLAAAADGTMTRRAGLALGVVTADCLPVLLYDGEETISAVHAGWRGLAAGILENAVELLLDARHTSYGTRGSTPTAWIGPAIGPCCFEVQEDVAARISARVGSGCVRTRRGSPRPFVDLVEAARVDLRRSGVLDVRCTATCTRCEPTWASYRRNGPEAGRNLAAIWRLPAS